MAILISDNYIPINFQMYKDIDKLESDPFLAPSGATRSSEKDPYGKQQGQPGAKLDSGKAPVARGALHYFPRAITAVAQLSGIGAKKYSWKGWEEVPDGLNRYGDALARHELRIEGDFSKRDPDTGVLECTAVAWNALARLELLLREIEEELEGSVGRGG